MATFSMVGVASGTDKCVCVSPDFDVATFLWFGDIIISNYFWVGFADWRWHLIQWVFYPKSSRPTPLAISIVSAFETVAAEIDSNVHELPSNGVLAVAAPHLTAAGFTVEMGKRSDEKIRVPVLFGLNGVLEKCFDADAYHESGGFVVEVEAGRGVVNNQFLKDLFQACMMHGVSYLAIAVRNTYRTSRDFDKVCRFFNTLYASQRLKLPLDGILVIGY